MGEKLAESFSKDFRQYMLRVKASKDIALEFEGLWEQTRRNSRLW